jgi:hypothetical protein
MGSSGDRGGDGSVSPGDPRPHRHLDLELRLAFVFRLDFFSDLVISLHQGVFGPLVYVGIHQKSCFKKV